MRIVFVDAHGIAIIGSCSRNEPRGEVSSELCSLLKIMNKVPSQQNRTFSCDFFQLDKFKIRDKMKL